MNRTISTPLVTMVLLFTAGCVMAGHETVKGSGVSRTEVREAPAFTGVRAAGGIDVTITMGNEQSVVVTADDNILPLIESEVKDGVLRIGHYGKESISYKTNLRAEIVVPSLKSAGIAGSGSVSIKGVSEEKLDLSIAGSGEITAHGAAETVSAKIAGSGEMDLADLVSKDTTAKISGSGDMIVHATESLEASIAGSGDIRYVGSPKNVNRSVAGSGSVKPKG